MEPCTVIVHLDGRNDRSIELSVPMHTCIYAILSQCIEQYIALYKAADLPPISGLYDMQTGIVLDLTTPLYKRAKMDSNQAQELHFGAVLLQKSNKSDAFRSWMKTIQSSFEKAAKARLSIEKKSLNTLKYIPPLPTLDKPVGTCKQLNLEPQLPAAIQIPAVNCLDTSPSSRKLTQEAQESLEIIQKTTTALAVALKQIQAASSCLNASLVHFQSVYQSTIIEQSLNSSKTVEKEWFSVAKTLMEPVFHGFQGLAAYQHELVASIERNWIQPWHAIQAQARNLKTLDDRAQTLFYKHTGLALDYLNDFAKPVDPTQENLIATASSAAKRAQIELGWQINQQIKSIFEFTQINAPNIATNLFKMEFSSPSKASTAPPMPQGSSSCFEIDAAMAKQLEILQELRGAQHKEAPAKQQGYLFQLQSRQNGNANEFKRFRRWCSIEKGAFTSNIDDEAASAVEIPLEKLSVRFFSENSPLAGLRHGFQLLHGDNPLWILQAPTYVELQGWLSSSLSNSPSVPPSVPPERFPPPPRKLERFHQATSFYEVARQHFSLPASIFVDECIANPSFSQSFLAEQGATQVSISQWTNDTLYGASSVRTRQFLLPIDSPLTRQSQIEAIDALFAWNDDHFKVLSIDKSPQVPYGSFFHVESVVHVYKRGRDTCELVVESAVVFSKSTMFQSMIEQSCLVETKKSYAKMLDWIHQWLHNRSKIND
ncbi:hypothetical protein Ae201684_011374 [Aphanomyces euteiches]|uniref:VASt domain-containing protein n=1 Tax=Aphanomyces euteiches TaxID=100861 RepID=A0A6G0WUW2_9STRA|nr:hypothetical protein Ae201684_011374 [Aphanomyces euteiches]KAH9144371.1 hypothetical protein AeRB84_011676 [Aphanomyces euteiches]